MQTTHLCLWCSTGDGSGGTAFHQFCGFGCGRCSVSGRGGRGGGCGGFRRFHFGYFVRQIDVRRSVWAHAHEQLWNRRQMELEPIDRGKKFKLKFGPHFFFHSKRLQTDRGTCAYPNAAQRLLKSAGPKVPPIVRNSTTIKAQKKREFGDK